MPAQWWWEIYWLKPKERHSSECWNPICDQRAFRHVQQLTQYQMHDDQNTSYSWILLSHHLHGVTHEEAHIQNYLRKVQDTSLFNTVTSKTIHLTPVLVPIYIQLTLTTGTCSSCLWSWAGWTILFRCGPAWETASAQTNTVKKCVHQPKPTQLKSVCISPNQHS